MSICGRKIWNFRSGETQRNHRHRAVNTNSKPDRHTDIWQSVHLHLCLLFLWFSNVCHSVCFWPTALKPGCITNFDMPFLMMVCICLANEIKFMLISIRHYIVCACPHHVWAATKGLGMGGLKSTLWCPLSLLSWSWCCLDGELKLVAGFTRMVPPWPCLYVAFYGRETQALFYKDWFR